MFNATLTRNDQLGGFTFSTFVSDSFMRDGDRLTNLVTNHVVHLLSEEIASKLRADIEKAISFEDLKHAVTKEIAERVGDLVANRLQGY